MPNPTAACPQCKRSFTTKRSDAVGCSRSCRRKLAKAARAPIQVPAVSGPDILPPAGDSDELHGWRRLPGGYLAPPADRRFTIRIDDGRS